MILSLLTFLKLHKKHFGFAACFLLLGVAMFGQVSFKAICSNASISKNEYAQVQFIVENATKVEQIVPPSFAKFQVVSGPNQQSSVTSINGAIKQFVAIQYVLKPRQPGNFRLGPALAKIDGKIIQSNSLTIIVLNSISGSTPSGGLSLTGINPSLKPLPPRQLL